MTFDEWKNSLSDEQKNALKYVANSEKRGIIKVDKDVAQASQKYLNKNDMLYINSKNIKQLKGYEDIVCHGDRYSLVFKDMMCKQENNIRLFKKGNIYLCAYRYFARYIYG